MVVIRPARHEDGPALREIERLAGEGFRGVGLAEVADDEPFSLEELDLYTDHGRSWVAASEVDAPVGYVLVDLVDRNAHIEQMSVYPRHQGRGVGRALLRQVCLWASAHGCLAITLTTYADVTWNRPLYEHLGFRVMAASEIGPELDAIRQAERARGLDRRRRVCMLLPLGAGSAPPA